MSVLLIMSRHAREYQSHLQSENLPSLTSFAAQDIHAAQPYLPACDLLFGEPSLAAQVMGQMPSLRWIQATWAGVEPLLAACRERSITLTNVRGVYGPLMSEYVFGYLLAIERRILTRWQAQQNHIWDGSDPGSLRGKLLGLLGVGSIGAHLARTAQLFGMRLRGYTRCSEEAPEIEQYFHGDQKLAFARGLDYLVCTLPGTAHTRGFVDAELLHALPTHAWLVNVGRGSTVDEGALVEALNRGRLGGAVLDVFQEEPLPPSHPLWRTPNTFITSHTAARNYPPDIANLFIENYRRYLSGEPLIGLVNLEEGY